MIKLVHTDFFILLPFCLLIFPVYQAVLQMYLSAMIRTFFILLACCVGIDLFAQSTVLYPIEIKGKWGYMNQNGEMAIDAVYDIAGDFNDGIAVVALHNLPCAINTKNERIIDTGLYQVMSGFSEGLCFVRDFRQHKAYIDTKGTRVIELADSLYDGRYFRNGLAVIGYQYDKHEVKFEVDISTIAFKFAYINRDGKFVTGFDYEDADDCYQGLARFKKGNRFGVLDSTGKEVIPAEFTLLGEFNEQKAVMGMKGKFGFIDTRGDIVIKPAYDMVFDFNDGMAGVWVKGKYGYIDHNGQMVIPARYEQIRAFSEGVAAVQKDGKWGFIDKKGEWVIANRFDNATVFSEGLCAVLVKRNWGFIDRYGKLAIPADFDALGSFHHGIADAVYHDLSIYLNRRGEILPKLNK